MNFDITKALVDVDFTLEEGKICGLIGENGSGKSTLSSIIAGIYHPVSGTMTFQGKPWHPENALAAAARGVGIIVQEAGTIPTVTVAQNIFAGNEKAFSQKGIVNLKKMNSEAGKILKEIGADAIAPDTLTMLMNMQDRKVVEIAKACTGHPKLLIVDETTNVLSQNGRDILFSLIHRMADAGNSVMIISHDIEEVIEHCDTVTILKDGHLSATLEKSEFDADRIKALMIGRELQGHFYREDDEGYSDEVVMEAKNITTLRDVTNVSLQLHKGEILGIGGLSDSGMHDLGKALFGEARLAKGEVLMRGKRIDNARTAVNNDIAYISKDRDRESLALDASISDNIASLGLNRNVIAGFIYSRIKERKYVNDEVSRLRVKCNSTNDIVRSLSGGNKQKVAFAKWFAHGADVFIMDCPTRGVDIGVKQEIYHLMNEMKKQGKVIVIISEEMPELIGMSDRLLVMKNGRINGEFYRKDGFSEKEIIEKMI